MARYMSRMKRHHDKERKNFIIAIIFLLSVLMTAGYAAYSRNLIINASGGVINDWRLEFTDVADAQVTGEAIEYATPQIGTDTFTSDLITDVEVSLSFPTDEISYDIEITNYSEKWDAEFIVYTVVSSAGDDNFIVWTISGITQGDRILTNNGTNDNTWIVTLTASWNPAKLTQIPEGTTMDFDTTYKETATIIMSFGAENPL